MTELRRRAYLEALGIDIWLARSEQSAGAALTIKPGQGSVLLIADSPSACAGELAADIQRSLGGDAVWAWPVQPGEGAGEGLDNAIRQQLFTRVVVFGKDIAGQVLGDEPPVVLLSSAITVSLRLEELAFDGQAKRSLWADLRHAAPA